MILGGGITGGPRTAYTMRISAASVPQMVVVPELGEAIRAQRLAMGLLQEDIAVRMGVTQPTVSRYEDGKVNVRAAPIIAQFLGRDVRDVRQLIFDASDAAAVSPGGENHVRLHQAMSELEARQPSAEPRRPGHHKPRR
jgi:transcriptional regulator with XRE-family HTH domain